MQLSKKHFRLQIDPLPSACLAMMRSGGLKCLAPATPPSPRVVQLFPLPVLVRSVVLVLDTPSCWHASWIREPSTAERYQNAKDQGIEFSKFLLGQRTGLRDGEQPLRWKRQEKLYGECGRWDQSLEDGQGRAHGIKGIDSLI